jgi:hypothetical protein
MACGIAGFTFDGFEWFLATAAVSQWAVIEFGHFYTERMKLDAARKAIAYGMHQVGEDYPAALALIGVRPQGGPAVKGKPLKDREDIAAVVAGYRDATYWRRTYLPDMAERMAHEVFKLVHSDQVFEQLWLFQLQ